MSPVDRDGAAAVVAVGDAVAGGAIVGTAVGVRVGTAVGVRVGTAVGVRVGTAVGVAVGAGVGSSTSPFELTFPAYCQSDVSERLKCKTGRTRNLK